MTILLTFSHLSLFDCVKEIDVQENFFAELLTKDRLLGSKVVCRLLASQYRVSMSVESRSPDMQDRKVKRSATIFAITLSMQSDHDKYIQTIKHLAGVPTPRQGYLSPFSSMNPL